MYLGLILIAAGLFTFCGAFFNWEFFMNSFKSRFWVKILGRNNARILYGIIGIAIVVGGLIIIL